MRNKPEEENHSAFMLPIGGQGCQIFNIMEWGKIEHDSGNSTDEENITADSLFKKSGEYCDPRKNFVV